MPWQLQWYLRNCLTFKHRTLRKLLSAEAVSCLYTSAFMLTAHRQQSCYVIVCWCFALVVLFRLNNEVDFDDETVADQLIRESD